jgi:hypothetical protein
MTVSSESSKAFVRGRGQFSCRGCSEKNLFSALDLGELPIANELLREEQSLIEKFPLHLRICRGCGLGQVADVVTPKRIFKDYRYLSSMSSIFLKHAADFVNEIIEEQLVTSNHWVLEIASNDGYLLKNFLAHNIKVIGVEPAENVGKLSKALGIETISEFFSSNLAVQILSEHGFPRLIIANNVMAHVPDLMDFVKGLAILCGPETRISIENPSLANILIKMQFDTVYHEHYSYLSATSVARISENHGLLLTRVEELPIHGGSNRYWLTKFTEKHFSDDSVKKMIQSEKDLGLFNPFKWIEYKDKVSKILCDFDNWIRATKRANGRIYGYGAAAKASTLLNSINIEPGLISAIADVSSEKQSRFMPPYGIKIISPSALLLESPTDVVIFPWNIKSEIARFLSENLGEGTRLWCVIPEMSEVKTF